MPINRVKRDEAIKVLRQYMGGKISNDVLLDGWPRDESDLNTLLQECIWHVQSDLEKHFHKGKHKLGAKDKKVIARVILFLGTDQKYDWPPSSRWALWVMGSISALSIGIGFHFDWEWALLCFLGSMLLVGVLVAPVVNRISLVNFKKRGNWEVWPFHTIEDFELANRNSRYLVGRKRSI